MHPVVHYIHPLEMQPEDRTWCGRSPHNPERTTTDPDKVTCKTCCKRLRPRLEVGGSKGNVTQRDS